MGPDQTNTPSASTDVNDTPSNGSQPDATQGVSNPPDTPILADNQSGAAQPGQTPQNQQPQGQQPPQPVQKQPTAPKVAPQPPTPQQVQQTVQQQQVQHASHIRNLFETMAGGPRYKETIDPNTGTTTYTKIPLSRGDIGMMIAMDLLSGSMAGLAQRGPGAEGRAAAAGFEQVQQQEKEEQQNQDQQASADFTRHAQVMENNLRMLQIAQTVGQKDFDQVQKVASQYQGPYEKMKEDYPQYIKAVVGEDGLSQYHATKNTALPTGNVIPVYDQKTGKQAVGTAGNKLWQMEYAVIDPNFKASNMLTADDLELAKKYHVPGLTNSDGSPISALTSFPLSLSMALNFKHQIVSAQLGDQDLQDYYKKLGVKDAPDFADQVKKDPTLLQAMGKFQPLLMATQGDIPKAIGELAAGGQGRKPEKNAAGKIMNLYGGSKMVQKYDQLVANEKEASKKETDREAEFSVIDSQSKADAVLADPSKFTGEQVAAAQKFRTQANSDANNKAYGQAAARTQGEIDTKKKNGIPLSGGPNSGSSIDYFEGDPAISQTIKPENVSPDGINHKFLETFSQKNPQLGMLVDAVIHGRNLNSRYGLAKKDGQMLDAAVAAASPGYNKNSAEAYTKTLDRYSPGGNMGKALINGGTALDHLSNLLDATNMWTSLGGVKSLGQWIDSKDTGSYKTGIANAPQELASLYANGGAAHEGDVKSYRDAYSGNPEAVKSAIKQQAINAMDKIEETANSYWASVPQSFDKPQTFLSKKAAAAYERITGRKVDPRLINPGAKYDDHIEVTGLNGNVQSAPPTGATGRAKSPADGKWYYHDSKGQNLGLVPGQ